MIGGLDGCGIRRERGKFACSPPQRRGSGIYRPSLRRNDMNGLSNLREETVEVARARVPFMQLRLMRLGGVDAKRAHYAAGL